MRNFTDRFWAGVAVVLTIVLIVAGFPAFQQTHGFPSSMFLTLGAVFGVWLIFVLRIVFVSRHVQQRGWHDNGPGML